MSKRARFGEITKFVLGAVGVAGVLVVAAAAPNVFQILPIFTRRRYAKKSLDQSFARLQQRGLVRLARGVRGWRVELTDKGREELFLFETQQKLLRRPKRWDRKWRLLIFDIEEKRKDTRDAIRRTLVRFGFCRLQDSVWVYPYDCEEILELLRTKYRVRHEALFIRADRIPNDKELRRHFQLSIK